MKVFIVFLALLTVNVNMLVYQDDQGLYESMMKKLDNTAEAVAGGAVMYLDALDYSEGSLSYDADEVKKLAEYELNRHINDDVSGKVISASYTVYMWDSDGDCRRLDAGGIEDLSASDAESLKEQYGLTDAASGCPLVVELEEHIKDPFRQPFLCAENIRVSSVYNTQGY